MSAQAFARPYHRNMRPKVSPVAAACTFPDGTSPSRHPGVHCYDPTHFLQAYGIDKLHKMGLTGKGQTIILAESFGSPTMQADLDHFSDTFGLPHTTIQFIYPNGPYVNPMETDDQVGWAGETTLDLEWAHAIAPDATLVNIVTNNAETVGLTGFPDLFAGIKTAVEQYPGAILSMSYGTGEPTFTPDDVKNFLQGSFHQIFQDAVNADMTLLASSGDSGSTDLNAKMDALISTPNASYPASDPLVTSVGGTSVQAGWVWTPEGTADDYWACQLAHNDKCPTNFFNSIPTTSVLETVWKEDWAVAAGGGGVSAIFDQPDYQLGLGEEIQQIAQGHRTVPDVSLNAAINGGVETYQSYTSASQGITKPEWQNVGGTSCASPEMAGLIALAGQRASETLGRTVGIGYLNPILYSLSRGDFNDIVAQALGTQKQVMIDNNGLYFSATLLAAKGPTVVPPVAVPGYSTTPGYDLATGRGSPRAVRFVLDVADARVAREMFLKLP